MNRWKVVSQRKVWRGEQGYDFPPLPEGRPGWKTDDCGDIKFFRLYIGKFQAGTVWPRESRVVLKSNRRYADGVGPNFRSDLAGWTANSSMTTEKWELDDLASAMDRLEQYYVKHLISQLSECEKSFKSCSVAERKVTRMVEV